MSQGMYGSTSSTREATGFSGGSMSFESSQEPKTLQDHLIQYCRENPAAAAGWCFGIGFVLGWRLKPW